MSQWKIIASRVILERSKTVYRNLEYQRDFQANMTDHWRAGKKKPTNIRLSPKQYSFPAQYTVAFNCLNFQNSRCVDR